MKKRNYTCRVHIETLQVMERQDYYVRIKRIGTKII